MAEPAAMRKRVVIDNSPRKRVLIGFGKRLTNR
jgi:hypothetical protein